jgi:hypothetical protein
MNSAPAVESSIKVISQLCGHNLYVLKNMVNKWCGNEHKMQVARIPTPSSYDARAVPWDTDIRRISYSIVKAPHVHL